MPPWLSFTRTDTVGFAGPSAKKHWKLPPLFVIVGVPVSDPPTPQLGEALANDCVSPPGSLTVNENVFEVPSFAAVAGLVSATVGATFTYHV